MREDSRVLEHNDIITLVERSFRYEFTPEMLARVQIAASHQSEHSMGSIAISAETPKKSSSLSGSVFSVSELPSSPATPKTPVPALRTGSNGQSPRVVASPMNSSVVDNEITTSPKLSPKVFKLVDSSELSVSPFNIVGASSLGMNVTSSTDNHNHYECDKENLDVAYESAVTEKSGFECESLVVSIEPAVVATATVAKPDTATIAELAIEAVAEPEKQDLQTESSVEIVERVAEEIAIPASNVENESNIVDNICKDAEVDNLAQNCESGVVFTSEICSSVAITESEVCGNVEMDNAEDKKCENVTDSTTQMSTKVDESVIETPIASNVIVTGTATTTESASEVTDACTETFTEASTETVIEASAEIVSECTSEAAEVTEALTETTSGIVETFTEVTPEIVEHKSNTSNDAFDIKAEAAKSFDMPEVVVVQESTVEGAELETPVTEMAIEMISPTENVVDSSDSVDCLNQENEQITEATEVTEATEATETTEVTDNNEIVNESVCETVKVESFDVAEDSNVVVEANDKVAFAMNIVATVETVPEVAIESCNDATEAEDVPQVPTESFAEVTNEVLCENISEASLENALSKDIVTEVSSNDAPETLTVDKVVSEFEEIASIEIGEPEESHEVASVEIGEPEESHEIAAIKIGESEESHELASVEIDADACDNNPITSPKRPLPEEFETPLRKSTRAHLTPVALESVKRQNALSGKTSSPATLPRSTGGRQLRTRSSSSQAEPVSPKSRTQKRSSSSTNNENEEPITISIDNDENTENNDHGSSSKKNKKNIDSVTPVRRSARSRVVNQK